MSPRTIGQQTNCCASTLGGAAQRSRSTTVGSRRLRSGPSMAQHTSPNQSRSHRPQDVKCERTSAGGLISDGSKARTTPALKETGRFEDERRVFCPSTGRALSPFHRARAQSIRENTWVARLAPQRSVIRSRRLHYSSKTPGNQGESRRPARLGCLLSAAVEVVPLFAWIGGALRGRIALEARTPRRALPAHQQNPAARSTPR